MTREKPSPRRRWLMGTSLGAAAILFVAGIVFWGGFNTAMEATNTMEFCVSCHEMHDNVYQEYLPTIHYVNRSGVRATCPDCHVPDPWVHKVVRKIKATNELFHWAMGTVDTPEKFDERRLHLARRVWDAMKETDSRECRNCHNFESMGPENQQPRARKQHLNAFKSGQTCIDCHKGIAHKDVRDLLTDAELEELEKPNPAYARPLPAAWAEFEINGSARNVAASPAPPAPSPVQEPASQVASASAASEGDAYDWSQAPAREIVLFYPGQSGMEWILNGRDHGGARPFIKAGDRCFDCHDEEAADMGRRMVTGEKLEPQPIPGKRGSIAVAVQASYDEDHVYFRFRWSGADHAPVPFVEGGKMDPENQVKLAVVLANDEVEFADRAGCWGGCHNDLRTMPFAPEPAVLRASPVAARLQSAQGITKYLTESRTEIEIKGEPNGGWDKLKEPSALQRELESGHFLEMIRVRSGAPDVEQGFVLAERSLEIATATSATLSRDGQTWVATIRRPLRSAEPGRLNLDTTQTYNFSFAIHDDYSSARYHHVSLGYKLGFDDTEAEIDARRR